MKHQFVEEALFSKTLWNIASLLHDIYQYILGTPENTDKIIDGLTCTQHW